MQSSTPFVVAVDDEPKVLSTLQRILAKVDIDVLGIQGGIKACEILREVTPSLILLDRAMPDMDGLEVCRWIREQPHLLEVPVVFVSGQAERDSIDECLQVGASDFIVKPFNTSELKLRVQLHLKLAESSRFVAAVSAAARDAIVTMDPDCIIAGWNRAAERIFGYTAREAVGSNLYSLIAPNRQPSDSSQDFEDLPQTGQWGRLGQMQELQAKCKSGDALPIEFSLSPMRIANHWWAVGIARDISERKRVELEQQRGYETLKLVLERMPIGVVLIDFDHRVRWCNSEVARMAGVPDARALLGSQCNGLLCPAHGGACPVLDQGERVENAERVFRRADGHEIPILKAVDQVEFAGEPMLLETFIDISDRKRQEAALYESEANYRGLFEGSHDALMTLEPPSWRFTSANPSTLKLFGAGSLQEFLSLGPGDVSSDRQPGGEDSASSAAAYIGRAMQEGSCFFDWTHRRISGEEFPCTVLLTRMVRGKHTFLQATVRDVSASKRLEAELGHARKLEAVGQLAAGIAHEINTPAQFIGDSVSFLKDAYGDVMALLDRVEALLADPAAAGDATQLAHAYAEAAERADLDYLRSEAPQALESCAEGVRRVAAIVRAMKEFAHPDQRQQKPADLNKAVENTLVIARNEYKYVAEVETELGDLPPVLCCVGDLNQVFLNLLVNAAHAIADARSAEGEKGTIRVSTRHEGDSVCLEFEDTGCGIPDEIRDRIFEPFFTTKEVGRGSGQGLAIARSIIVDKHKGTLEVKTQVGKGTTFSIRLPVTGTQKPARTISAGAA
ncbi:MAG: PAS domain S-box protein [Pseudomonadota bacterium]